MTTSTNQTYTNLYEQLLTLRTDVLNIMKTNPDPKIDPTPYFSCLAKITDLHLQVISMPQSMGIYPFASIVLLIKEIHDILIPDQPIDLPSVLDSLL